jgi:hypothetical protein
MRSFLALLVIACSGSRDIDRPPNEVLAAESLAELMNHRTKYSTETLDSAIRELVVYLCDATGQQAVNIREAHVEEIVAAKSNSILDAGCGWQLLENGEIVTGRLLIGRLWVAPNFRPGRRPPAIRLPQYDPCFECKPPGR